MANEPERFKEEVRKTLRRHAEAINKHTAKRNTYLIWKVLLLESSRAGASRNEIHQLDEIHISYTRYYGINVFRLWIGKISGLCFRQSRRSSQTDGISTMFGRNDKNSQREIQQQMADNIQWIKGARK